MGSAMCSFAGHFYGLVRKDRGLGGETGGDQPYSRLIPFKVWAQNPIPGPAPRVLCIMDTLCVLGKVGWVPLPSPGLGHARSPGT